MNLNLDNFKIVKEFKSSRTSKVFMVEDLETGKQFIHKTSYFVHGHHAKLEVEIHAQLKHKHIIQLVHSEVHDNKCVMLIEYARNGDLYSWINRLYVLSEHKIIKFFKEVVEAVSNVHESGFVHRDIKPENILIAKRFSPKLADFGASREIGKLKNTFCGTLEYMAPEVLLKEEQSEKVDIWALGVLLYEMFHGKTPFKNMSAEEIKSRIKSNDLRFKSDLEEPIRQLIQRLLKYDPNERPSAQEVLADPVLNIPVLPSMPSLEEFGSAIVGQSMAELRAVEDQPTPENRNNSPSGSFLKENQGGDSESTSIRSTSKDLNRNDSIERSNDAVRQSFASRSKLKQGELILDTNVITGDITHNSSFAPQEHASQTGEVFELGLHEVPVKPRATDHFVPATESIFSLRNIANFKSKAYGSSPRLLSDMQKQVDQHLSFLSNKSAKQLEEVKKENPLSLTVCKSTNSGDRTFDSASSQSLHRSQTAVSDKSSGHQAAGKLCHVASLSPSRLIENSLG